MTAGRPATPIEVHRRRGTDRVDRVPPSAELAALPPADLVTIVDACPVEFQSGGRRLWSAIWHEAIVWVSPQSDLEAVREACELVDDVAAARRQYRSSRDAKDARALATLSKELSAALGRLGFDPSARARLGVAEVKKQSALEELMARRKSR